MTDPKGYYAHRDIMTGKTKILHFNNIRHALADHGPEVTKALERVTSTGPRSGRLYSYRGRKYRASAPGEPPAKRSGRLSKSFKSVSRSFELVIGNTAFERGFPYPKALEEGTSRMAKRPYFIRTIDSLHYRLEQELQDLGAL